VTQRNVLELAHEVALDADFFALKAAGVIEYVVDGHGGGIGKLPVIHCLPLLDQTWMFFIIPTSRLAW
jgi:hypothetical protein